MKAKLQSMLQTAAALAVLALLLWAAFESVVRIAAWVGGLQTELGTAIVAAAATVVVALASNALSKHFERRDAVERENRLKKVPLYEQLIEFIFRVLQQSKPGAATMTDTEL